MASVHKKGGSGGQTNFEIQDLHATAFLTPPQVTGHISRRNSFWKSEIEVDTGLNLPVFPATIHLSASLPSPVTSTTPRTSPIGTIIAASVAESLLHLLKGNSTYENEKSEEGLVVDSGFCLFGDIRFHLILWAGTRGGNAAGWRYRLSRILLPPKSDYQIGTT